MNRLVFALPLLLISIRAHALTISDLWRTPDQEAQHLLQHGEPSQAARLFTDPRRRAYAELQAGQAANAARLLAPFHDARSLYNRGNALARTGQLHEALASYDAALKRSPHDRDAQHNRDLVAKALQHQSENPQPGQNKPGQPHKSQQPQQPQKQQHQGSPTNPSGGKNPGSTKQNASDSAHADDQSKQAQSKAQSTQSKSQPARAAARPGTGAGADAKPATTGATTYPAQATPTGQKAPPSELAQDRTADSMSPPSSLKPQSEAKPPPASEQTLALQQWLRRIPNDSAELLRRKFLIEHLMRERGAPP